MKVKVEGVARPIEEVVSGEYDKRNRGEPYIKYTTAITLYDGVPGWQEVVSLARRRERYTGNKLDPTLMSVEVQELDGLIELLIATRDALNARGIETRPEWDREVSDD